MNETDHNLSDRQTEEKHPFHHRKHLIWKIGVLKIIVFNLDIIKIVNINKITFKQNFKRSLFDTFECNLRNQSALSKKKYKPRLTFLRFITLNKTLQRLYC